MSEEKDLNPRQMKFVEGIEAGMSLADAYQQAGYKSTDDARYSNASRLIRNDKIIKELDDRLFGRKRAAQQRLGGMVDGSTNAYLKILKLAANDDARLLELQRRVATDVFNFIGLKPKEQVEHSGEVNINMLDLIMERKKQAESE